MGAYGKLILGVGINDSTEKLHEFELVGGKQKRIWICPFYQAWKDCLTRCYSPIFHARRPTYVGCSVHPDWLRFSNFKLWMESQDWHGKSLDKDILFPGNKIYVPDRCVFVSRALNNFLGDCRKAKGDYPIGVSWHRRTSTFRADCNNPFTGKSEFLGHFLSPHAAHEAWRSRKHQHACIYADMQADPRVAQALRIRYLPAAEHN